MARIILSVFASALAMFCLAGLFTGVLAKDFIARNVNPAWLRQPPDLALTFLGYFLLACVMAWSYRKFVPQVRRPAASGLKLGLFFAVAWLMPYTVVLFSIYDFPYKALGVDLPWALVEQGLGGGVMGLVQGKRQHA